MVDYLSMTSVLIEPTFNDTRLTYATGFVLREGEKNFLATNWHVVTGRDSVTNKVLHTKAALPNSLIVWFHTKPKEQNKIAWKAVRIPLYHSDKIDDIDKRWIEHPRGKVVDVVLLPLEELPETVIYPIEINLTSTDMIPQPAMPVSLIGFPFGKSGGGLLPIRVTGFIASEPFIDIDSLPLFYVNASGRSGLSGSPVILRLSSGYGTSDGKFVFGGGYKTKFMGIYSGRVCEGSEVCRVWKPTVLEQILNSLRRVGLTQAQV